MNKRVLKIWPFWPKGIKYHDQYLAEVMNEDRVFTTFAYPNFEESNYKGFIENNKNIQIDESYQSIHFNFISFFGKPIPYNLFSFVKKIKDLNPEIIHIFGISNFTTLFALLAATIACFKGKIIFNDHSDPNERRSGLVPAIYRLLFRIAYKLFIRDRYTIIVPDDSARDELAMRYGRSVLKVIKIFPLGFDSKVFKFKPNSRKVGLPLNIGFAGKIFPQKRIEILIDAIKEFPIGSIVLNIAGLNSGQPSDYQKTLIDRAKNVGDHIKFCKFISSPTLLAEFYSSLDVAIYPGSISITTFEANGCGCPVIVFESIKGLHNRVDNNRGNLFGTREQLIMIINDYIEKKVCNRLDFSNIADESLRYSWQELKFLYYKEYGFNMGKIDA